MFVLGCFLVFELRRPKHISLCVSQPWRCAVSVCCSNGKSFKTNLGRSCRQDSSAKGKPNAGHPRFPTNLCNPSPGPRDCVMDVSQHAPLSGGHPHNGTIPQKRLLNQSELSQQDQTQISFSRLRDHCRHIPRQIVTQPSA